MRVSALTAMSERQLQEAIIEAAELHRWMVYHTYDSRRSKAGFPDLMMVRDGVLLALEMKTESGRLTPEQTEWIDALQSVPGVKAALVRPRDLDRLITKVLP